MKPRNLVLTGLIVPLLVSVLPASGIAADSSTLQISSPAISNGAAVPKQYTCSGDNQSPPLAWTNVPSGTKSLVLWMEDPDAPSGTFVHWIVYDIPPGSHGVEAGVGSGKLGANSMGKAAYMGPCPPPGKPHHYHFKLFALDTKLDLPTAPQPQAVQNAMTAHVKQSAELVGIFGR